MVNERLTRVRLLNYRTRSAAAYEAIRYRALKRRNDRGSSVAAVRQLAAAAIPCSHLSFDSENSRWDHLRSVPTH